MAQSIAKSIYNHSHKIQINYLIVIYFFYRFRHALMTWGEKFSSKEVDDAFDAMEIDDNGRIDTDALITLLTGAAEEGEGEAA